MTRTTAASKDVAVSEEETEDDELDPRRRLSTSFDPVSGCGWFVGHEAGKRKTKKTSLLFILNDLSISLRWNSSDHVTLERALDNERADRVWAYRYS